ncbi:MAG: hypothetical protein RIB32_01330 [Phycisphaerales bacterium]
MRISRTLLPALTLGVSAAAPAQADLLEFLITVGGDPDMGIGSAHAVVVFDTDAPPILSDENGDTFAGVGGWIEGVAVASGFDGMGTDPAPAFARGPLRLATLQYDQRFNTYTIELASDNATMEMFVTESSAFDAQLPSLPDSIEGYRPTFPDGEIGVSFVIENRAGAFGSYSVLAGGLSGGAGFNVRFVDELPAYACSPADIDRNGVLNFDDIDAFVDGFLSGCP